jgi:hypothetical protein
MRRHGWRVAGSLGPTEEYWVGPDAVGVVLPPTEPGRDEYVLYAHDLCQIAVAWIEPWLIEHAPDDAEAHRRIVHAANTILESVEPSAASRSRWYTGTTLAAIRRHVEHLWRHPRDRRAWERLQRLAREDYRLPRWGEREERRPERARRDDLRREAWDHPRVCGIERAGLGNTHLRIATDYTLPDGHGVDLWAPRGQWDTLCDYGDTGMTLNIELGALGAVYRAVERIDGVRVVVGGGAALVTDVDGDDIDAAITRLGEACVRVARALWKVDA